MVKTHCGQVDKNKEQTQVFQNHFHCRNGCLYLILSHDHRPTWEVNMHVSSYISSIFYPSKTGFTHSNDGCSVSLGKMMGKMAG